MPVLNRIDWISRQIAAGRCVHIGVGQARDPDKAKYKITVHPTTVPGLIGFAKDTVLSWLDTIKSQVSQNIGMDRGHHHSDGRSEVCIWISKFRPEPAAQHHREPASSSAAGSAPFKVTQLLFSEVPRRAKTLEAVMPTDASPNFMGTWEVLPTCLVRLHSWLIHTAPDGMSLALISARFGGETHTVLELPESTSLLEWLVQFPRFFEIHTFDVGTHVAPIPLQ
jgi:hypothetical protein